MNSQKFVVGGIVGGVLYFLLGYVFYGLLLKSFMESNGMAVNMDTITWWAMVVGNLAGGFLLAYILSKAGVTTAGGGAGTGFIVGLLMSLSTDLIMYGVGHGLTLKGIAGDVAAAAVMSAIVGALVGWVLGMSKKTVAAA
jgi:ABC-type anion transport system duplicated permease subunit